MGDSLGNPAGRTLREALLSGPVTSWLAARGLEVFCEVPFGASAIDLVGARFEPFLAVAVELKTGFTWKVLRQAIQRQLTAHEVYACAPTKPGKTALDFARRHGIGLLRVLDGQVFVGVEPGGQRHPHPRYLERLAERLHHMPKGGVGGKPQLKGIGPRQDVLARVKLYLAEHPKAGWAEIFANVPNHYAHAHSMKGVMVRMGVSRG